MKHLPCILDMLFVSTLFLQEPSLGQVRLMTLYPDSASPTAVVLRAWINPDGDMGELRFYWGVSPNYSNMISAGFFSGSEQIEVRKRLEGLTPDVLYECRAAWGGTNPEMGGIIRFRTIADSSRVGYVNYLAYFGGNIGNELAFGIHTQGTDCLDASLGEMWIPPPGPQGAPDFRFVDRHGFNSQCMDQGMLLDLRGYRGAAQIDTYKVQFDPGNFGYPAEISWSDMSRRYNGDVHLQDLSGTLVNVDMKSQRSVLVTESIPGFLIIASSPVNPFIVLSSPSENRKPTIFHLGQNYPNPFNPSTTIHYHLPAEEYVILRLYDLLGREVTTLVNEHQKADHHKITFDASRLASGVYWYRLTAGSLVATRKLMLLR